MTKETIDFEGNKIEIITLLDTDIKEIDDRFYDDIFKIHYLPRTNISEKQMTQIYNKLEKEIPKIIDSYKTKYPNFCKNYEYHDSFRKTLQGDSYIDSKNVFNEIIISLNLKITHDKP